MLSKPWPLLPAADVNRTDIDQLRGALAQLSDSGVTGALRPEGLGNLAKELGLGSFSGDDIVGLWHIGLMRADLVRADCAIERSGLTLLKREDDGCSLYLDSRVIQHRIEGHGGALQATGEVGDGIELWFHPFRLYVLFHVQRTLQVETTNTQYLIYLVQKHAATFFAQAEDAAGADLPQFVKDEFDAFLECGILAHGFLRLRCGAPFSWPIFYGRSFVAEARRKRLGAAP